MKLISILFAALLFGSCAPSFESTPEDRLFFRKIKTPSVESEWYTYSAAWADSPDFVTIKTKKILDTLCISDNIADLYVVDSNRIVIGFYGYPSLYMKPIKMPQILQGCPIIIDTTYKPLPPHARQPFSERKETK
jgi:hypothetical protein